MTITDLTVGAATTGNNASVIPGAPSGLAVGDFVLIHAAIRNSGTGTPNTPTGWQRLTVAGDSVALFGRFWQTGDTMPTVSFTGGVANADTYARALKARGVGLDVMTETAAAIQANASAANIAYPALNVPGADHLLVMHLWKQDDATSLATPGGWTAQGLTNMTTGDDMLAALYTQLQTTEADISASSVVVTGGVSAISKAVLVALKPAPSIIATEIDLFPPRVLVTVTGLTLADDVELFRVADGTRTAVRAGEVTGITDTSFVRVDGELPYGTPVSYVVVVNGVAEYSTAAVTYTLPGGKPVLSDAITGESAVVVIAAWDEKAYSRSASVFRVGGRNVVVSGDMGQFEATIQLFLEHYSSTENFFALMSGATEGVLQLRRPATQYDGVDCYIVITDAREKRFSQDGSDGRRLWQISVAETDAWSSGLEASGFTYQDVADAYSGQTYADVEADYATYLALASGDFS